MKVGIIATPESYKEQESVFKKCGLDSLKIEKSQQLEEIDGLVICSQDIYGLEKIIKELDIIEDIKKKARDDFPVIGISAAMVILAKDYKRKLSLGILDVEIKIEEDVEREYFEIPLKIPALGKETFKGVFKKKLYINKIKPNIGILCQIDNEKVVFIRQGNFLATAFHPELANDLRVYKYFIQIIKDYKVK